MAWLVGMRPPSPDPTAAAAAADAAQLAKDQKTAHTKAQANSDKQRPAPGDSEPSRAPRPPYSGPPKVALQISDPSTGTCPSVFTLSVNVYVIKGEVTDAKAELLVFKDKIERTIPLMPVAEDWSAQIGGIPTKRTARVVVVAKGPGGEDTEIRDITHECPGEPLDKREKLVDISPKENEIEQKFSEFDFDFDGGGGEGKKSGSADN